MRVAVVADAHLGGPGGDAQPLADQLERLPEEGAGRLLLLGDLFQAWIGFHQYETPGIRLFLEAIAMLRRRGVRVDYVEGNRDFFLAEGPYRDCFDSVGGECAFAAGGVRYLAVHGDGLNDRDRQYLAWRWLSKSGPVKMVIRGVPRRIVGRFVDAAERRLSHTNFKHKSAIPEAAIRRYGTRRLLDAWFRSRRVEWLG